MFFFSRDDCIWIGSVKLSQVRREYLPSALSLLGNSFEILYVTNRGFLQVNYVDSDQEIWWMCCRSNFNNVLACLPCCFIKDSLKRNILEIDLTMFFEIRNFGNIWAMRVIFFLKTFKLKLDFKNPKKNQEKVFCFWDNCIWICCVKLSLLRREYLPSTLSVLGKSFEILHITNRQFLQVNCLHSDQ